MIYSKNLPLIYLIVMLTFVVGCEGDEGPIGPSGLNSLIKVSSEDPGATCVNGGIKIMTGLDANNNSLLDTDEITNTSYVCNGLEGKQSVVDVTEEMPGDNCKYGGVMITTGTDANDNGVLDATEIEVTRYVCNGIDGIVNEEIQIRLVDGIGGAANTTSSTPVVVSGTSSFDIRNFVNADSVVFVADPYVSNATNFALVELYNVTDGQVIANSLLRTNNLSEERIQLKTNNLYNELPQKQINLGIRLSSETNGQFSASGVPYLFLYRSH